MSVYRIKNTWWVDISHLKNRIRKKSPDNTRTGAMSYETVLRGRLSRGEPLIPPEPKSIPTFQEFALEQWYPTYVLTNNKYSEAMSKRSALHKHLIPHFGTTQLDSISVLLIERYKATRLQTGLSPKTINNHLHMLSSCLKIAVEWEVITSVPKIRPLKVTRQPFDHLTEAECVTLLGHTGTFFWYVIILMALHTGLRRGELLGLEWQDIDLNQSILTVRRTIVRGRVSTPKSHKIRHVPLTRELKQNLISFQNRSGSMSGPVFSLLEGNLLHEESMRRAIQRFCRKAGMRRIGWHVLRHTFASMLVSRGVSIKAVQELMGHSDIQTTMRYAHLFSWQLHQAVSVLDSSFAYTNKKELRQPGDNHESERGYLPLPTESEQFGNPYGYKEKQGQHPCFPR